jgi:outer membrane protein assembly factor BamB
MTSSPAIDNAGNIYFGSRDGYLYSLTTAGTLKWKSTAKMGDIFSSPAIDAYGTIYIGSIDKNVYAFDNFGKQKWVFKTKGMIYKINPIVDSKGNIIIGSYDGSLYCIKNDGTSLWNYKARTKVLTTASIDVNGNIWFGSDNTLYVLNNNGNLITSFSTSENILGNISIDKNETVYFSNRNGTLYACKLIATNSTSNYNIDLVWSYETFVKGDYGMAVGWDGTVYLCNQTIFAINPPSDNSKKGVLIKSFNTTDYYINKNNKNPKTSFASQVSPTIDGNGNIYFSALATYYIFDKNLNVINSYPISNVNPTITENLVSPVIGKDGTVYVGTLTGLLIAFYKFSTVSCPNGQDQQICICANRLGIDYRKGPVRQLTQQEMQSLNECMRPKMGDGQTTKDPFYLGTLGKVACSNYWHNNREEYYKCMHDCRSKFSNDGQAFIKCAGQAPNELSYK